MADSAQQKVVPTPPWYVRLDGEELDLQDLAGSVRSGPVRVFQARNERYYLAAAELDQLNDPTEVYRRSFTILQILSGLRLARGQVPAVVKPDAVAWTDGAGNWIKQRLWHTFDVRVVAKERGDKPESHVVGAPTTSEIWVRVAERDSRVRAVLRDLGGDIDFPRLRRVFEHMWTEYHPTSVTVAMRQMALAGLGEEGDFRRFNDSVNRSIEDAAHSEFRYAPFANALSLKNAKAWILGVVERWISSKRSTLESQILLQRTQTTRA